MVLLNSPAALHYLAAVSNHYLLRDGVKQTFVVVGLACRLEFVRFAAGLD